MIKNTKFGKITRSFGLATMMGSISHEAHARDVTSCTLVKSGEISWYGDELRGNLMANRQPFNPDVVTAAAPKELLPLGAEIVVVTESGASIEVTITDRGPYAKNRILDGSERMAELLGYRNAGHTEASLYLC